MNETKKRWLRDHEVEKQTDGVVKAQTLRKDRLGAQHYPFHRVGRSVFYDLAEINAVIEKSRFGGKVAA